MNLNTTLYLTIEVIIIPIISIKSPDPLINDIIKGLVSILSNIDIKTITKKELIEIKNIAEDYTRKISFDLNVTLPEHLDELTELSDVLETVMSLEHVLKILLPGRIKFALGNLKEINKKNNSEILKFVSD